MRNPTSLKQKEKGHKYNKHYRKKKSQEKTIKETKEIDKTKKERNREIEKKKTGKWPRNPPPNKIITEVCCVRHIPSTPSLLFHPSTQTSSLVLVVQDRSTRDLSLNEMLSLWSDTDGRDLDAEEVLNVTDIVDSRLWPLLDGSSVHDRLGLPAWVSLVDGLDLCQSGSIGWEVLEDFTVEFVGLADLDLLKDIENVELGKVNAGVVVDAVRVLDEHKIEPSTTTSAGGGDADFVADGADKFSNLLEKALVHS